MLYIHTHTHTVSDNTQNGIKDLLKNKNNGGGAGGDERKE
jgi:hypothetical protein